MKTFQTFSEWRLYFKCAVVKIGVGLYRLIQAIIGGLVSLLRALWRALVRAVGNYPDLALGGFLVAVLLTWMLTFVSMRTRAVGAEEQRDSISFQLQAFKQRHGYFDE